jgi:hypothetical protein
MADVPVRGFPKYWSQTLASLNSQYHAIKNKFREADSVVQKVHNIISDIKIFAGCIPTKVGGSSEWTTIVNSAEENRANFCKVLGWKPQFSALYCMYTATMNELKAVSAQPKHSGAVNKTSLKPTAQVDDFQKVKRRKRHNSNDNSQSVNKSTKTIRTSAAVKLPPNAVSTRNNFAPVRTADMDTETTGEENMLPGQQMTFGCSAMSTVDSCKTYI